MGNSQKRLKSRRPSATSRHVAADWRHDELYVPDRFLLLLFHELRPDENQKDRGEVLSDFSFSVLLDLKPRRKSPSLQNI